MTPATVDWRTITAKLVKMEERLADLAQLGEIGEHGMKLDHFRELAAERILILVVDLAVDINNHVSAVELRRAADSYRESFTLAAKAGLIHRDLANALEPSASMRNRLVHDYLEVDEEQVAAAVPLALEQYGRYIDQVRDWTLKRTGQG